MTTDLFLVAHGLDVRALGRVVPPGCLAWVQCGPAPSWDGDDLVLTLPEWGPRQPSVHLLPSFAPLGPAPCAFRFELSARIGGAWSPWVASTTIGEASFPPLPQGTDGVVWEVDVAECRRPAEAVRLRVRWRGAVPVAWLVTLSAADASPPCTDPPGGRAQLAVPPLSQMNAAPALRARICSPTCVAMVLGYWQRPVTPEELATEVFHPGLDLYGVWPSAIRAAASRGVAGYLLRFPDLASAAWCLDRGIPVVTSIRYAAGALSGAALAATSGHLVVLTGFQADDALVNDPAAPDISSVARRYPVQQLGRAWLAGSGVGYVLFDPARV